MRERQRENVQATEDIITLCLVWVYLHTSVPVFIIWTINPVLILEKMLIKKSPEKKINNLRQ